MQTTADEAADEAIARVIADVELRTRVEALETRLAMWERTLVANAQSTSSALSSLSCCISSLSETVNRLIRNR